MQKIENLHIKIKKAAARKNITLKLLANDMDMTEQGLYNILKRDNMPLDKFLAMANGLNIDPCELLSTIIKSDNVDDNSTNINSNDATINQLLEQVIKTNKIIENLFNKQ